MIAKCAKCSHLFTVDHYGQHSCPQCGAELMLTEPVSSPEAPPAVSPVGPAREGIPTPWEERAQRGFLPALIETIRLTVFDPVGFYGRMRVDTATGAVSYYWLNTAIGTLLGQVWTVALAGAGLGRDLLKNLPQGHPLGKWAEAVDSPLFKITGPLGSVLLAPLVLYLVSAIIHLGARLFGCSKNGFPATLRSVSYASGVNFVQIVPFCGGVIVPVWSIVLVIIGIWKTQRTRLGTALGAVMLPVLLGGCCLSLPVVLLVLVVFGYLGTLAGQ
jgi:hypothetical protein